MPAAIPSVRRHSLNLIQLPMTIAPALEPARVPPRIQPMVVCCRATASLGAFRAGVRGTCRPSGTPRPRTRPPRRSLASMASSRFSTIRGLASAPSDSEVTNTVVRRAGRVLEGSSGRHDQDHRPGLSGRGQYRRVHRLTARPELVASDQRLIYRPRLSPPDVMDRTGFYQNRSGPLTAVLELRYSLVTPSHRKTWA